MSHIVPQRRPYLVLTAFAVLAVGVAVILATVPLPARAAVSGGEGEAVDRFDVLEYRVQGNTRLAPRTIETAVYPLLGPGRTIADVELARQALEQLYKDAGYPTVFVDIPEQELAGGVVRLAVTEGRIARLRVTGSRYYANGWIRDQLPEVAAGRVPRLAEFNEELATFNARSSDRSVTPVIRPGQQPGTAEMELKVVDQLPLHASAEINNQQTISTTSEYRFAADLGYGNLWQRDHAISLGFETAVEEPDDYRSISAAYSWRPGMSATEFRLGLNRTDTATVPAAGFTVPGEGEATIYRASATRPLGAAGAVGSLGQVGSLALEYRDYDDKLLCAPVCFDAPLSYLKLAVDWNAFLPSDKRTQAFGATASLGIRGFGSEAAEVEFTRFASRTNFFIVQGRYSLEQELPGDLVLGWRLSGQLTPSTVVTKEQYAAGGNATVRGYNESEVLGDNGLLSSLELRSPNWGPALWKPLDELRAFGFFDWAGLSLHDTLPGEDDSASIGSVGLGIRVGTPVADLGLTWAYPYRDGAPRFPSSDPDANEATVEGDDRFLLYLRSGF